MRFEAGIGGHPSKRKTESGGGGGLGSIVRTSTICYC